MLCPYKMQINIWMKNSLKIKMTKLNRLTWKYFFEQKWEEISGWFEDASLFIFAITLSTGLAFQLLWVKDLETGLPVWKTGAIIGLFMVGFWVLIGLIALVKHIIKWLKSNWEEASIMAKMELGK